VRDKRKFKKKKRAGTGDGRGRAGSGGLARKKRPVRQAKSQGAKRGRQRPGNWEAAGPSQGEKERDPPGDGQDPLGQRGNVSAVKKRRHVKKRVDGDRRVLQ